MSLHNDSTGKVVEVYFAAITRRDFSFEGKSYRAKPLLVSPSIVKGYTCPEGCGGCCFKFTLDYIPGEEWPYRLKPRTVQFNGKKILVYTDAQLDNKSSRCRNLTRPDGRCGIHGKHPFTCDFELIRVHQSATYNRLGAQLFGRGWSYERTDGGKGAKCEMLDATRDSISDAVRKLHRLKKWADYFGLVSHIDTIIQFAATSPHDDALRLYPDAMTERQRASFKVNQHHAERRELTVL